MVKTELQIVILDGRKYRRIRYEREGVPASRQYRYQVNTTTKHWRDLPARAKHAIARIDAALDNHRTNA